MVVVQRPVLAEVAAVRVTALLQAAGLVPPHTSQVPPRLPTAESGNEQHSHKVIN